MQTASKSTLRSQPKNKISKVEFVALMAMISAMVAMAIDAMLPALTIIGDELSPQNPEYSQFVITSFMLGMGCGTLFVGPLADRFDRKPVLLAGISLFILTSFMAFLSPSMSMLLATRFIMGVAVSAPRVVSQAIVRDQFVGRQMAQITSFIMMIFALVPALAPMIGNAIIIGFGWRYIFFGFVIFALVVGCWFMFRQAETLPPEKRRSLSFSLLFQAIIEIFSNTTSRRAIFAQSLCFALLVSVLTTIHSVFDQTFDRAETFPYWFALIAVFASSASFVNAKLVPKLGMRKIVLMALLAQFTFAVFALVMFSFNILPFVMFILWVTSIFLIVGLTLGNLTALAMEPLGHIAGSAASVIMAMGTITAVLIGSPIGLFSNGSPVSLFCGGIVCVILAAYLTFKIERP